MVLYLLDFHENIRFSITLKDFHRISWRPLANRENYYCIYWSTKKNACKICRIFMKQSRNIPIFSIPRALCRNFPQNFIGNFLRTYRTVWKVSKYGVIWTLRILGNISLWTSQNDSLMPTLSAKINILLTVAKKPKFSRRALFHMKTIVILKYFVNDCLRTHFSFC